MNNRVFFRSSATLARRVVARLALLPLLPLLPLAINPVCAQSASPPSRQAAPTTTGASGASTLEFRSALEGYKSYTEEKTIDWKQANDNVGKIGGWREYAREASQPESAAGSADIPTNTNPATDSKADPKAGSAKP